MGLTALSMRLDPRTAPSEVQTEEAAKRFEALLLEQLMKPLTDTESSLGPAWGTGGPGGKLARELHVQELARIAAERDSLKLPELFAHGAGSGRRDEEEPAR